jgi:hypothetical protein
MPNRAPTGPRRALGFLCPRTVTSSINDCRYHYGGISDDAHRWASRLLRISSMETRVGTRSS